MFICKTSDCLRVIYSVGLAMVLSGCSKPFEPWGYRFLPNEKGYAVPTKVGAKDPLVGLVSKDKLEMLIRYGKPTLVSSKENYELMHSNRKVEEWVYLNLRKHLVFYEDTGELYLEQNLDSLDMLSYQGYVEAGMTPEQLERVKGEPVHIENTHLNYGAEEKWVYRLDQRYDEAYYFSRNLLFLWQKEDKEGKTDAFNF